MRAAIDIGTNTVRLLLGAVVDGRICSPQYRQIITRLGGGLTKKEGLTPEAMERTLFALKQFSEIIHLAPPAQSRVVGTEALRRAVNADEFVRKVRKETGLTVEIISGQEEARLTASGVLSILNPLPPRSLLFDIGGGSTEFILLEGQQVQFEKSYPLGVVALAEETDSNRVQSNIATLIQALFNDLSLRHSHCLPRLELIGTAGTMTTLAALALGMRVYDRSQVNNCILQQSWLQQTHRQLTQLTPQQREQLPGIEPGRGDLILPGLAIVLALLQTFAAQRIVVSDAGLLEGLLLADLDRS